MDEDGSASSDRVGEVPADGLGTTQNKKTLLRQAPKRGELLLLFPRTDSLFVLDRCNAVRM